MVGIVQWLERQIVALDIVGSTPTTHPIFFFLGWQNLVHRGVAKR